MIHDIFAAFGRFIAWGAVVTILVLFLALIGRNAGA